MKKTKPKLITIFLILLCVSTSHAQKTANISLKLIKEETRQQDAEKKQNTKTKLYTPNLELVGYEQFSEDRSKSYIETVEGNRFEVAPYQRTKIANKGNTIVKIGATREEEKINRHTCMGGFTVPQSIAFYDASGQELKHYKNISSGLNAVISENGHLVTCGGQIKNIQTLESVEGGYLALPEKTYFKNFPSNTRYNHINNKLFTFAPNPYLTLYAPSGEKLWETETSYFTVESFLIDSDAQTIATLNRNYGIDAPTSTLTVFNNDGTIRFTHPNNQGIRIHFLANGKYLFMQNLDYQGLSLVDSFTGKILWQMKDCLEIINTNRNANSIDMTTILKNQFLILTTKGEFIVKDFKKRSRATDWVQLLDLKTGKLLSKYNLGKQIQKGDKFIKMIEIIDDNHFKINVKDKSYYFEIEKN